MMSFINPLVQASVATLCVVADLMCQNISSTSIVDSGKDFRDLIAFSIRLAISTIIGILDDFRLMILSIVTKVYRGVRFVLLSILSIMLSFKDMVLSAKSTSPSSTKAQGSDYQAYSYRSALKARLR